MKKKKKVKRKQKMRNYINDEEELEEKEIMQIIRRMKKAAGVNKILKEIWLHGGTILKKKLLEIMKEAWRTGNISRD